MTLDPESVSAVNRPDDPRLARLLVEYPEPVIILDRNANLCWANPTAEVFFGRTLEDALGQSVIDDIHPDDLELVRRSLESVQNRKVGNPLEVRAKIDSQWRLLEVIGVPVPWFADSAILFSIRDLTDRRRFEVARDDTARFRSLVHNSTTITLLVSPAGTIDSVSGALTRLLGHDPELLEGQPLASIVLGADRAVLERALEDALLGSTATNPVTVQLRLLRHDASDAVAYELDFVNLVDDPTVHGLVVSANDVSARVAAEIELRHTFSLLNATLEATADGILVVGSDRRVESFNSQFARMWRIPDEILSQRDDVATLAFVIDQLADPDAFLARVDELYAQPTAESNDVIVFKDGRIVERFSKPQYVEGEVVGRVWSFSDITSQKRLENELEHLAFHDALTGLANRALFRDRLDQASARSERTGRNFAVLFLDLDNFKTVNDSLGHSAGDDLLRLVAEGLRSCLRRVDTAARLGGDEFAILVEDVDNRREVVKLAERVMDVLHRPVTVANQRISTSASIGITFGISGNTSEQLLRNADLAMYLAKSQGKDRYEEFEEHMHTAILERLELESGLRRASDNREFVVFYQPIVDLESERVVGMEALVRWQHPTNGLTEPAAFIPFAEETGLVEAIDDFVLFETCRQAREWHERGLTPDDFLASVNLSAREITAPNISGRVAASLRHSGFTPTNLILELTESALMGDLDAAVRNLQSLKEIGVRLAIDDFGTGYSSFTHLERLPIDILKVDQSFVANIAGHDEQAEVGVAIVQLALTLGLTPIAEGVEHAEQSVRLLELGCRLAQGFHLSVPLDAASFEALLHNQHAAA